MRWKVVRPSLTAVTMPPSPAVVSTMPAADFAMSVGARDRDAHLGLSQRRRIVRTVAAHAHHVARLLEGPNQAILIVGQHVRHTPQSFPA
jgi:hypothetical protein